MKEIRISRRSFLQAAGLSAAALGLSACGSASSAAAPAGTAASAAGSTAASAAAVNWPSGSTINFDVPAKAGGGTDMITRFFTTPWAEVLGKNVVVTNYETSEVGSQHTKNAKPDGMTLSMAACTSMDVYLSGGSEVNPHEDFTCISKLTSGGPQVLFTNVDAPYSNLTELKEYAAAHPGEVICGCSLGGTSQLMWIKLVKAMGDIQLNYVQCSNEADKLSNVAAGSINLGNGSLNNAQSYEQDGKIKVLGILSNSETLGKDDFAEGLGDQYLTSWEQGFKDSSWEAGYYLVGPAGMDRALCDAINASAKQGTEAQAFIDGMKQMSMFIEWKDVDGSNADYDKEWETQVELTKAAGVNTRS